MGHKTWYMLSDLKSVSDKQHIMVRGLHHPSLSREQWCSLPTKAPAHRCGLTWSCSLKGLEVRNAAGFLLTDHNDLGITLPSIDQLEGTEDL